MRYEFYPGNLINVDVSRKLHIRQIWLLFMAHIGVSARTAASMQQTANTASEQVMTRGCRSDRVSALWSEDVKWYLYSEARMNLGGSSGKGFSPISSSTVQSTRTRTTDRHWSACCTAILHGSIAWPFLSWLQIVTLTSKSRRFIVIPPTIILSMHYLPRTELAF